jgi:hypothetical protein
MTVPRGGVPQWKQRKSNYDAHLNASINLVGGVHDPDTGRYGTLRDTGHPTKDAAMDVQRGLYASGKHVGVSVKCTIVAEPDGTYTVEFFTINKQHARAYVLQKYGKDRAGWAYDPRAKKEKVT